jgi:hypothetical protein
VPAVTVEIAPEAKSAEATTIAFRVADPPIPVFVDTTGRRRRRTRFAFYAIGGLSAAYAGLVGVSLAGGPIAPEELIPFSVVNAPEPDAPATRGPVDPVYLNESSSGRQQHRRDGAVQTPYSQPRQVSGGGGGTPLGVNASPSESRSSGPIGIPAPSGVPGSPTTVPSANPTLESTPAPTGSPSAQPTPQSTTAPSGGTGSPAPSNPGSGTNQTINQVQTPAPTAQPSNVPAPNVPAATASAASNNAGPAANADASQAEDGE